jgi:ribosomal protein S18 acetylase RimI-like enzyme
MTLTKTIAARSLIESDIERTLTTLVEAFSEDPVLRYVIEERSEWDRIAPRYFSMILKKALREGCSFVDDELRGVAVWEAPGQKTGIVEQSLGLARMTLMLRGALSKAFRMQSFTEPYRPRRLHWYLAYVGTAPRFQGKGIGRTVLEPILGLAERESLPAYLECSRQENIGFYRALGFSLVDEVKIPDGPTVWPMIREPNRT